MSKDFTKPAAFQPTPAMQLWVDSSAKLMSANISEIADECKVSRQSWYQWQKKPGFNEWYRKVWLERLGSELWRLDVIGMQRAHEDFRYWDAMQKKLGGYNTVVELPIPIMMGLSTLDERSNDG